MDGGASVGGGGSGVLISLRVEREGGAPTSKHTPRKSKAKVKPKASKEAHQSRPKLNGHAIL